MAIPSIAASLSAAQPASPAGPAGFATRVGETTDVTRVAAEQPRQQASQAQLEDAVDKVREALPPVARNLQFSLDKDTGHTVVKVLDASTNELIRQIPSEEFLQISKALDVYSGLLLRQKA